VLSVGALVGAFVGWFVGGNVKGCVGVGIIVVGTFVGAFVGTFVVGAFVGACVGAFVGTSVGESGTSTGARVVGAIGEGVFGETTGEEVCRPVGDLVDFGCLGAELLGVALLVTPRMVGGAEDRLGAVLLERRGA